MDVIKCQFDNCIFENTSFNILCPSWNINYYLIKFEAYLLTKKRLADNILMSYMSDPRDYADYLKSKHELEIQDADLKKLKAYLKYLKNLELLPRSMSRKKSSLKFFIKSMQYI